MRTNRLLAALAVVVALALSTPASAFAAMGNMGSFGSSGGMAADAAAQTAASAAAMPTDDPNAEQLGLVPKLFRLTGESHAAEGEGSLPTEGVGAIFPNLLSVTTTPSSISTGVECHMDEVCGYDPCTCGKPDAWGHCACGGFRETAPTVTISTSDANVAQVVQAFGQTWIVPDGAGTATVQIAADLGLPAGGGHLRGPVLPRAAHCAPCAPQAGRAPRLEGARRGIEGGVSLDLACQAPIREVREVPSRAS